MPHIDAPELARAIVVLLGIILFGFDTAQIYCQILTTYFRHLVYRLFPFSGHFLPILKISIFICNYRHYAFI